MDTSAFHAAVNKIFTATYVRLSKRYLPVYGKEFGAYLAAAMCNVMAGTKADKPEAVDFARENAALIEQALREQATDHDLRNAVTQAVRVHAAINLRDNREDAFALFQRLDDLGILLPGGNAPSERTFFKLADDFYSASVKRAPDASD